MRSKLILLLVVLMTAAGPRQLEWVAIGDSITYLNDHQDETGNRMLKGYMTIVKEKLPHINFINQGHNGWTSGGIAKNIENLKLTKADVYTIFLGTNDWWQGRPLGTLADYQNNTGNETVNGSFRIIIDKLKRLNGNAKIILMTPLQRGDFVYINGFKNSAFGSYKAKNGQFLSQFADAIVAIAELEEFSVVDLYNKSGINQKNIIKYKRLKDGAGYKNYHYPEYIDKVFDTKDEYPYPPEAINMTYDGLHPSDKGNLKIAKMLVEILKRI